MRTRLKTEPLLGPVAALMCLLLSGCSSDGTGGSNVDGMAAAPGLGTGGAGAAFGTGGGSFGTGGAATGGAGATAGGPSGGTSSEVLAARTWRLTHDQYRKSVLDLIGVEPDLTNFKPESGNGMFANFSSTAFVQVDLAANYFEQALSLAEEIPATELAALTSCDLSATCKDAFIAELGAKAFRSAVPEDVRLRLVALFDASAASETEEIGFRSVLAAVLNSPLFLYRKEIGSSEDEASAEFSLTVDQVVEFLSYSLLDAPPPDWLKEMAQTATFDPAGLEALVSQLLDQPEFQPQFTAFLSEWIEVTHFEGVEKVPESFPGFRLVQADMEDETWAFLEQSSQPENGLGNLLLDPVPSVSTELDDFYFSDPSAPEEAERVGVLGLGTVLASHAKSYLTSPTLRGTFIRRRFFCQDITLPDDFTPPPLSVAEELGTATTTRELYEQHQTDPTCNACHSLTDNIGFALEAYDGAGRFRTEDSTQGPAVPLDLASEITASDVNRPLMGARDLSVALSESAQVKQCFAQQAFRFYFGQKETSKTVPAVASAAERVIAADQIRELLVGLFVTETTLTRQREAF